MLQFSKLKKSRNEWRTKATFRADKLREMKKVHKYYKEKTAKLIETNEQLKKELEEINKKKIIL